MHQTAYVGGGNSINASSMYVPSFPQLSRITLAPDGANGEGAGGGGGGEAGVANGAAQPEFKVPDGKVLIDVADHERFRQNTERVRGMQGYFESGSKYGFKKPEDFQPWGEFRQFAEQRKLTPQMLRAAFEEEAGEAAKQSAFDPDAFKKELGEQFVTKDTLAFERAMGKHEMLSDKATGLEQEALKELIDEGATPRDKFLIQNAFRAILSDPRFIRAYPDGHPLAEKALMPHDSESIKAVVAHVKKELGLAAGAEVAQIGAEAAKGGKKTPTPAGSSSTSKANNTGDGTRRRPDGKPHPDDVQKAFDEIQAKRRGGAMSSAGG